MGKSDRDCFTRDDYARDDYARDDYARDDYARPIMQQDYYAPTLLSAGTFIHQSLFFCLFQNFRKKFFAYFGIMYLYFFVSLHFFSFCLRTLIFEFVY